MDLAFVDPPMGQMLTGMVSKHINTDQRFNQSNQGLGFETPNGLLTGYYLNSLNKPSFYAAQEMTTGPYNLGPVAFRGGLLAGGVTGYGSPVTPLLMPELTATYGDQTAALGVVPPIKGVTPMTLALQLRKKF
jgi:hypothetical protein